MDLGNLIPKAKVSYLNLALVIFKKMRPYVSISIIGILAFAPVSFMMRAMKNDIITLEYPINYFISQCIHHGEIPYWFNTWGMGFPLLSNITWGIFSTPQIAFCAIFNYNIYTLHLEFIFFVLLAGWGMFYLLQKHFLEDKRIAELLSVGYMLSGFVVGSSQWMLYVSAASFLPLIISSMLTLTKNPSLKGAVQFAVIYTLMFTSTYPAFTIITTYGIVLWIIPIIARRSKKSFPLKFIFIAATLTILFCLPCALFTLELLAHLKRGTPLDPNTAFFNSNYLHPAAIATAILPISSVRMSFSNTEGTMLHTYMGLFALIILPHSLHKATRTKDINALLILGSAIFYLLLAFGNITPLRELLNFLPGFSFFRNSAIFRLFFIFLLLIFIATTNKQEKLHQLCHNKTIIYTAIVFSVLICFTVVTTFNAHSILQQKTASSYIKNLSVVDTIFISSTIQLIFVMAIISLIATKKYQSLRLVFIVDVIINTLMCTPFFSVSSYSIAEVNSIFHSIDGFPIQKTKLGQAQTTYIDRKRNSWQNVNVFRKEVSINESYRGPLTLKNNYNFNYSIDRAFFADKQIAFVSSEHKSDERVNIEIKAQKPDEVEVTTSSHEPFTITMMQNYFPGWTASCNGQRLSLSLYQKAGQSFIVPAGNNNTFKIKYNRPDALFFSILMHLSIISFLLSRFYFKVKQIIRTHNKFI